MVLTNAQYALVAELLDEVHDVKNSFRELQTKVFDLEDENYRLRERISELYSMINRIDYADDIDEIKVEIKRLKAKF